MNDRLFTATRELADSSRALLDALQFKPMPDVEVAVLDALSDLTVWLESYHEERALAALAAAGLPRTVPR